MARDTITDGDPSTQIPRSELQDSIPDDIWGPALSASQEDSDGEDPFGPQPKRFMQTEHQKRQQKRDLRIRQLAWVLRKMKRDHKEQQQRLKKQKQRASPIEILPSELILKIMQHTHPEDLLSLVNSSKINLSIFKANETAIYRGIEIEQFPDWKWLFGDTTNRTSAQSQHLKDAVSVEHSFQYDGRSGLRWWDVQLLETLRTIDSNQFIGLLNVTFLQEMQHRVDEDIEATESYTQKKVARRTAICLRSLAFLRPEVVKEEDRSENGPLVHCNGLPWKARHLLINEQPASIKSEIRSLLQDVVDRLYETLEGVLTRWTLRELDSPGIHGKPEEAKKWISQLVTGLILEEIIPCWYSDIIDSRITLCFARKTFYVELENALTILLDRRDYGLLDTLPWVEDGVEFGRAIGLDVEGLVDGRLVGNWVDIASRHDVTEGE